MRVPEVVIPAQVNFPGIGKKIVIQPLFKIAVGIIGVVRQGIIEVVSARIVAIGKSYWAKAGSD